MWSCNNTANNDQEVYSKPDEFNPERWKVGSSNTKLSKVGSIKNVKSGAAENKLKAEKEDKKRELNNGPNQKITPENLAFGQGVRDCVGMEFCLMAWKAVSFELTCNYCWRIKTVWRYLACLYR